jgi:hypothetical protein
MKSPCLVIAVLMAAPVLMADVTGKWQVAITVSGSDREQSCTFTQKEAELTGTCATEGGEVQISGKVEDRKVTWTYKANYQGSPLTVVFRGNLESATKITGTVVAEELGFEGQFTATPVK